MKIRILSIVIALCGIELLAWWWMNPPTSSDTIPLLSWNTKLLGAAHAVDDSNPNHRISWHPELVKEYQSSLNCSSGTVCEIQHNTGITIHAALFQWDRSSSVNAIEAYKHRPEQCLGSIGMNLIHTYADKHYQVGSETLVFTHTLFRDKKGTPVHAFKATWIAGAGKSSSKGMTQITEWRHLRTWAALHRYKPSHARVVQGAVRSVNTPEKAWEMYRVFVLGSLEIR